MSQENADKPTLYSVIDKFNDLIEKIQQEQKEIKKSIRQGDTEKDSGDQYITFLSLVIDDVREIKKDSRKISKKPRKTPWVPSGIFSKVTISKELAKFTGWEIDSQHSRVEVYRFLYAYVKDNKLNEINERKDIIEPDFKLRRLLGYDEERDGPLKFFNIQKYLKRQGHFIVKE
jgi:chromatin remodeling complex protein RSC6